MANNLFFGKINPNLKIQPGSVGKLRLRRKPNNELTDNPKIRRSSYTSDSEDSADIRLKTVKRPENDKENAPENPLFRDSDSDGESPKKKKPIAPDNVSFSTVPNSPDSEVRLCSRMTGMQMAEKPAKPSDSLSFGGDVSFGCRTPFQEISPRTPVRKTLDFDDQSFATRVTDDDDAIEVLDSEEENEISECPPVADSYINCSSSVGGQSDFFNNIPPASHAVSHSMIQKAKHGAKNSPRLPPIPIINIINQSIVNESFGENVNQHVEIGPTDDEGEEVVDLTLDESGAKDMQLPSIHSSTTPDYRSNSNKNTPIKRKATNTPAVKFDSDTNTPVQRSLSNRNLNTPGILSTKMSSSTKKKNGGSVTKINIKLDLKISIRDGDSSSESSSSAESEAASTSHSSHVDNQSGAKKESNLLELADSCHTPARNSDGIVIDDELQALLTDLYGDGWKTPQLLKSCKSKTFRTNLRKSLHSNNFESFMNNIPTDLESTRISSSSQGSSETVKPQSGSKKAGFIKPSTQPKKTPLLKPANNSSDNDEKKSAIKVTTPKPPATPKYLDICDSDTSSENSDDEFNPNDTWNASSDEEYESEKDRIAKRQSVVRESRRFDDIVFTKNDTIEEERKLEELLRKYQFKKPESATKTITKKKLFTPSHYYEDEEEPPVTPKAVPAVTVTKATPTTLKKLESPKRKLFKTPTPLKSTPKRFGPLSFLQSLDAETNKSLCDPEALVYRSNYKGKKHELAERLFKLYNEKVFSSQLTDVPIKWNKKLLTTGGRCNNSRRAGVRKSAIELSDKVLTSADRLRCTLIHEMCHAAAWILDGENGHGKTWKGYTSRANRVFPELPAIKVCHSYTIEYRYTYLCVSCKARSLAHSKSKKVEEIRCSLCKGSIQLFENKKNERGEVEMVPIVRREATGFAKFVKLKFKEVKRPYMSHAAVMKELSTQFQALSVEEKAQL